MGREFVSQTLEWMEVDSLRIRMEMFYHWIYPLTRCSCAI